MTTLDPVNFPIIAGASSGITVRANPATKLPFARLKVFAQQGNHWARTCVQAMESLSSGQFKNFVYTSQPEKLPMYTLVLPGCKVECAKLSDSQFIIYSIKVDGSYFSQQAAHKKPALYNITKDDGAWAPTIAKDGEIKDEKYRVVAIADRQEKLADAVLAAGQGIRRFNEPTVQARRYGWDMHYTPGESSIGGLKSILKRSVENDPVVFESAYLLATAMTSAQKTPEVNWISVGGGSEVLTQAMRILKQQHVNFKGKEHYVLFSSPTTNIVRAQSLAMELGFKFSGSSRSINYLNANQLIGGLSGGGALIAEVNRFRYDPEYNILNAGQGIYSEFKTAAKDVGLLKVSGMAVAGAVGLAAVAPITTTGILAAAGVVGTCVAVGVKCAAIGVPLAKAWLPRICAEKL